MRWDWPPLRPFDNEVIVQLPKRPPVRERRAMRVEPATLDYASPRFSADRATILRHAIGWAFGLGWIMGWFSLAPDNGPVTGYIALSGLILPGGLWLVAVICNAPGYFSRVLSAAIVVLISIVLAGIYGFLMLLMLAVGAG
jgi:hypothetical protein